MRFLQQTPARLRQRSRLCPSSRNNLGAGPSATSAICTSEGAGVARILAIVLGTAGLRQSGSRRQIIRTITSPMFSAVFIIAGMPHGSKCSWGDSLVRRGLPGILDGGTATNRSRAAQLKRPGAFRFPWSLHLQQHVFCLSSPHPELARHDHDALQ